MYKIVSIFCFHCALRQWNLISVSSDFLFKENGQIGELKTKIEAGLRHYAVDDFDCQQLTEHKYVLRWHYKWLVCMQGKENAGYFRPAGLRLRY